MVDIIEKTAYPDARHMVWTLKSPFAPISESIWSTMFGYNMMPKELNANPALAETLAIGTGYKIIDKYQPAIGFEYRKNPDYWGGDPFIERWNSPIIPEYSNQYSQFISGNIMDFSPTAKDVLLLAKDAPETVIVANEIPDNSATRIRFGRVSPEKWPWADPRVRIAMQRSIDYKSIGIFLSNQQAFEAAGIPIELTPMTHLPQHRGYWLNPEKDELGALSANYLYDPAEARKLTAAAGHTGPVEIPIFVLPVAGEIPEADQLVMDSMERSGAIKLDVHRALSRQEHDKYRLEGQYDGIIPQGGSSQDADYFITRDYHSKGRLGTAGLTNQAYPDPRIDAIGDAQRKELDIEKRFQLLKDFQHLAAELMPAVPGRHLYTEFSFRWPWLHNSNYGPGGSPPGGREVWGGHLHWLDPAMPGRDRGS
jgi:peptide/nickel transport system substrate-binding protein